MGEFEEADRSAVIALWQACGLTRSWNDPSSDIDHAIRSPASTILLARHETRIIASVMVGFDGHRGWVYYLAVDPAARGRGIGRRMMAAAEDWLRQCQVPKINLMIRSDNAPAIGFYRALGYVAQEVATMGKRLDGKQQR